MNYHTIKKTVLVAAGLLLIPAVSVASRPFSWRFEVTNGVSNEPDFADLLLPANSVWDVHYASGVAISSGNPPVVFVQTSLPPGSEDEPLRQRLFIVPQGRVGNVVSYDQEVTARYTGDVRAGVDRLTTGSASVSLIGTLSPILEGDYNFDGRVDAADFATWQDNVTDWPVNALDVWRTNYGRSIRSSVAVAVPEASAATLLLVSAFGMIHHSLRR